MKKFLKLQPKVVDIDNSQPTSWSSGQQLQKSSRIVNVSLLDGPNPQHSNSTISTACPFTKNISKGSTKSKESRSNKQGNETSKGNGTSSSNGNDITESIEINAQSQSLKQKQNFTNQFKLKMVFEKLFDYVGHLSKSEKFYAECKACKAENQVSKLYLYDEHTLKFNATRHYTTQHPQISLDDEKNKSHKIDSFFGSNHNNATKYTDSDPIQKKFDTCLMDLISVDGLPFTTMQGLGFKNLVSALNPCLNIKSRNTVVRNLKTKINSVILPEIIQELSCVSETNLHLSADIWTSKKGDGVWGLKAHYVFEDKNTNQWILRTKTLAIKAFNNKHTANHIQAKFEECLTKLNINPDQVGSIVTDSAANMIAAFKNCENIENIQYVEESSSDSESQLEILGVEDPDIEIGDYEEEDGNSDGSDGTDEESSEELDEQTENNINRRFRFGESYSRSSCYSHTLQLVVKKALTKDSNSNKILSSTGKIVKFFNKSSYWKKRLQKAAGKDLVKPATTRWNSNYHMLKRISSDEVYTNVAKLLHEANNSPAPPKSLREIPTLPSKAKMIEVAKLLSHVANATDKLQSESVTSSLIQYEIRSAFDEIAKIETNWFTELKTALLEEFVSRFETKLRESVPVLSAMLDPRQKQDVFKVCVTPFKNQKLSCPGVEYATKMLTGIYKNALNGNTANDSTSDVTNSPEDGFSKLPAAKKADSTSEIDQYLSLPRAAFNTDPLEFWSKNKNVFPKLSALAKRYLAVPASTGSVERLFSTTGALARARRSRLTPETMEMLVLYREYRKPNLLKLYPNDCKRKRKKSMTEANSKKSKAVSTPTI